MQVLRFLLFPVFVYEEKKEVIEGQYRIFHNTLNLMAILLRSWDRNVFASALRFLVQGCFALVWLLFFGCRKSHLPRQSPRLQIQLYLLATVH